MVDSKIELQKKTESTVILFRVVLQTFDYLVQVSSYTCKRKMKHGAYPQRERSDLHGRVAQS